VIPTRGRPELVQRAVRSALGQTVADLEVVVVIDGEDPATHAALAEVVDPRLRLLTNPVSLGGSGARNRGVREARGEWVAFLDDDDEWLPAKMERQLLSLVPVRALRPIGLCQAMVRSRTSEFVWPRRAPRADEPFSEYLYVRSGLFAGEGAIQTSMIVAPRELLLEVPFDEDVPRFQEADWALRAVRTGSPVILTPEPLTVWNVEEGRASITSRHAGDWRLALAWVRERRHLLTRRAYAGFVLVHVSSLAAAAGERAAAGELWREARAHGRPGTLDAALFLGKTLLPPSLRSRLRTLLTGRRRPATP
jgi:glycosyltransferase involved in cell wall biosynthesis